MKICKKCLVVKPEDQFYIYDRKAGKRRGECSECTNARLKKGTMAKGEEYRQKHNAYQKAYREANFEASREHDRTYGKTEKCRLTRAAWRNSNRDKLHEREKQRRKMNPLKFLHDSIRSRHKKIMGSFDGVVSIRRFVEVMTAAESCSYCGCRLGEGFANGTSKWIARTVDRIDPDRGYEEDNICASCWMCNRAKGTRTREEFLDWLHRAAAHNSAAPDPHSTHPMHIPSWAIIDFCRYAVGRQSYQVGTTVDWLVAHWDELPRHARSIIRNDLEDEFRRDDEARAGGREGLPLGMDMDRRQWERVRAKYRADADLG
jgi:hypothetical protein